MFNFRDKTVVITGGGSGIGAAMVRRFAKHGAKVAIIEVNLQKAKELVSEISQFSAGIRCYEADVTDQEKIIHTIKLVIDELESVDVLINNAGISQIGKLDQTREEDFDRVFNVNVKGVYNCMYAVIEHMKSRQSGVILNMCSVAATLGIPDRFAYSATKGAIRSMTFAVAKDYLDHNIRCNCISPARVHTPFVDNYLKVNYPGKEEEMFTKLEATQPIGRMAKPVEIANLALYLCSEEASFITGTDYTIDGGFVTLNT
jgi:NAD(P)-dependent dehydrogenase (short-subunit alcohol dehydrogenase family)